MTSNTRPEARVINLGSINIDYGYQVPHFVRPGETLAATARAVHGRQGPQPNRGDGARGPRGRARGPRRTGRRAFERILEAEGVDVSAIETDPSTPSGHTVIQVTPEAENSILTSARTPGSRRRFWSAPSRPRTPATGP